MLSARPNPVSIGVPSWHPLGTGWYTPEKAANVNPKAAPKTPLSAEDKVAELHRGSAKDANVADVMRRLPIDSSQLAHIQTHSASRTRRCATGSIRRTSTPADRLGSVIELQRPGAFEADCLPNGVHQQP